MGRPKGAKNKPKQASFFEPILNLEIPIAVMDWLAEMPGFRALVILKTPDGKRHSVELYLTPVSDADNFVGTGQDAVLREAFLKAIASYNQEAADRGKPLIV